jgi:hypothetical protein
MGPYADENGPVPNYGLTYSMWQSPNPRENETVWTGIIVKGGHARVGGVSTPEIHEYTPVTMGMITDGTSNTILVMEKAVNAKYYTFARDNQYKDWWDTGYYHTADYTSMRMFSIGHSSAWFGPEDRGLIADTVQRPASWIDGWSDGRTIELGFGSPHPLATNAVFGDGSVRAVNNQIPISLLIRLGKRSDGEAIDTSSVAL